jgi:predicted HAD superfamily phosphohydrolase YqeG
MIGDNLVLGVAGGQAAGLRTIWLQPKRRPDSWSFVGPAVLRQSPQVRA